MEGKELPNLNFGLTVKSLHCVIHPNVAPNILDHYLRKPEDQDYAVGTILGTMDGTLINICSTFAVPQYKDKDGVPIIDSNYQEKMLKFYRKVNPKEGLLGLYISAKNLDEYGMSLLDYYSRLFKESEKKRALLPNPLIMLVDPLMESSTLQIKVLNLLSAFIKGSPFFCECSYKFAVNNTERTGLDLIFYGQEHYDTQAILSKAHDELDPAQISDLMANQRLFPNKEAIKKNLTELVHALKDCENYIEMVRSGEQQPDAAIAQALNATLNKFSGDDLATLEKIAKENFEDSIILSNLTKL